LEVGGSGFTAALIRLHIEGKLLAFIEIVHAGALDGRNVNEHIRAAIVLHDEPKTFLGVEKLNCTCGHQWPPYKTRKASFPHTNHSQGLCYIRILRVLGEGRMAETARSSAIANSANLAIPHTHCNQRHTIAAARHYLLWYGRMKKDISFYSEALGKEVHGSYTLEQGTLTVYSEDREKQIQVGTSAKDPEYLARQMLIEIERERPG
jgi:hypothetical protein